jgi:hypothetical protein
VGGGVERDELSLALVDALRGAEELTQTHVAELQMGLGAQSGAIAIEQRAQYALALLHLGHGRPAEALDELLGMISTAVRLEHNPVPLPLRHAGRR